MDMENQILEEEQEVLEEGVDEELLEEVLNLSDDEKIGAMEALLFSLGHSVEIGTLAECLEIPEEEAGDIINTLIKKYAKDKFGIEIIRLENSVQMCTKKKYYNVIKKMVKTPRKYTLSETVLETLSIIAYKQPVTRVEIEKIRGVSCGHQINRLLEYDLIKELGRLDAPGKPLLFGTTEQFLKSFGVESIEDLPQASPERIADFEAEAVREIESVKV